MPASVEIRGLDEALKQLGSLERIQDLLRRPIRHWTDQGVRDMQRYPSPLPNQRYVRTYRLRQGWGGRVMDLPDGIQGRVRNQNVPYNIWVQQEQTQAGIHHGRWLTDEQWVRQNENQIVRDCEEAIEDAIK